MGQGHSSLIKGLAKLSAERIEFELNMDVEFVVASVGADGGVKLWDGKALAKEALSSGKSIKKTKKTTGDGGVVASFTKISGIMCLGNLRAAENTRPTSILNF